MEEEEEEEEDTEEEEEEEEKEVVVVVNDLFWKHALGLERLAVLREAAFMLETSDFFDHHC